MTHPHISFSEPSVVSQAPQDVTRWGPWQFPYIERLSDGRLHVRYHIAADSATAYGLPNGHAVSSDQGQTWETVQSIDAPGGLLLPSGDRLRSVALPSKRREEVHLPEPIAETRGTYRVQYVHYRAEDVPPDLDGWRFARLAARGGGWVEETAAVHIPGAVRTVAEDVLVFPWLYQDRLRVARDGSLWATLHAKRMVGGKLQEKHRVLFLRSTDEGHTWDLQSEIPYQPHPSADPFASQRDGFTEPEFNFMPDGSILCLIRTTDGLGVGPMYVARSTDGGRAWTRPTVYDDCGVWPQLLTLGNGVTLAAYGRPGLYARATADPSGQAWETRQAVIEPGEIGKDTCSYADIIALDERTALLVYSDFNYPDAQGRGCKTILTRKILVTTDL